MIRFDKFTQKAQEAIQQAQSLAEQNQHQAIHALHLLLALAAEKDASVKGYHRIERSYGEFVRSFALPPTVENDKVAADYKNGVLTITLPKKETAKPRQVKVAIN